MPINVLWHAPERMSYSCCHLLNKMLDDYPTEHFTKGMERPEGGAVIVFHGGNEATPLVAEEICKWAKDRPWCIFISIGDEATDFPYDMLFHPNMKLWVQTPKPSKINKAARYLIEGFPHDCRQLLDATGDIPRDLDWMFAGQINHPRRQAMEDVLLQYPYGQRAYWPTKSFGAGLPHAEYYALMRRAKVVPCPSGLATPDSFRFAEALEAGCIPLLDAYAPDGVEGYWTMVLGRDHPFIEVKDWADFPRLIAGLLKPNIHEQVQYLTQTWWRKYKRAFDSWLLYDIAKLGGFR